MTRDGATDGRVNRTGIASALPRAQDMQRDMELFPPTSTGTRAGPAVVRTLYAREGHSIGTVPVPAKGVDAAPLLTDKLGERLAFERTGTRLYEALLSKFHAIGSRGWGPGRDDIVEILEQEHDHFAMLRDRIEERGGDPTAITPSANVAAVASEGVQKVLTDPRTTLLQCLEAILIAELTDTEGWTALIELAEDAEEEQLVRAFQDALRTEERHLERVRAWIREGREATLEAIAP